ncbi:MAG: hypothetical protein U0O22_01855 [Acutalibacteraceae bacterium]
MAIFTNQATLTYNGNVTNSNITTGEIIEVVSATKNALIDDYTPNDNIAYIISIVNSGNTPISGLTVTDNLGAYTFNSSTLVPLTYVENSVAYYVNGVLQTAPTVASISPLTFTGIDVPANSNAIIIYEAQTNQFAPLDVDGSITNQAVITGSGIGTPITVTDVINTEDVARLTITKTMSPTTVTENGQLTYTFVIQNSGNVPINATDDVILTDTFNPALQGITVKFNDVVWTEGVNYQYTPATGFFTSLNGQITVPAATYTQDPTTGAWITTPGVSVLTITGTV